MKKFGSLAVALAAVAMLSTTPAMAKDIAVNTPEIPQAPPVSAPQTPKVDLSESLGSKTKEAADSAKEKIANSAEKLKENLPGARQGQEAVEVTQENVTVETPSGLAQESQTVITPETPAKQ